MSEDKYIRKVQCAVTNFLFCGDECLLLHRNPNKRVDANRLNGVGGRIESGENFLEAALREIEEETGYKVSQEEMKFCGVANFEGGYSEDWIVCFFRAEVKDKIIPLGSKTDDGELVWIDKDKVLDSEYELVDDLNYVFKEIVSNKETFFMNFKLNEEEKIVSASIAKL